MKGGQVEGYGSRVKVSAGTKRKEKEMLYLMLGLFQIPTGPQREPKTMADFRLVLTPRQLLCKPQACQEGSQREQLREREESKNEFRAGGL